MAMAISSITVVTNANRLRKMKILPHLAVSEGEWKEDNKGENQMIKRKLFVDDMTCNHCKLRITKTVEVLKGVKTVHIDLEQKWVEIEYDERVIQIEQIKTAIESAGYNPVIRN